MLHDHDSDPLTVASLAPIRLDRARLAYLSACRTAFNPSTDLADEAIHLTTAFQLAGYPQVVGTLWEIDDELAVRVADTFYTALVTGDNTIDTTRAAQALHHAVDPGSPEEPQRSVTKCHVRRSTIPLQRWPDPPNVAVHLLSRRGGPPERRWAETSCGV